MTRTLVDDHRLHRDETGRRAPAASAVKDVSPRARDWAEIQERMLVPLYEAVYERLEIREGTRLLALGCGSGLSLLMAATLGAQVTGVDSDQELLALADERLHAEPVPAGRGEAAGPGTLLPADRMGDASGPGRAPYDVITAFRPIGPVAGNTRSPAPALRGAVPLARRGAPVVLAGWGPPERCASAGVMGVAGRLTDRLRKGTWRPAHRDDLEDVAARAGLRPDGSGRVACPFGYADMASAVRGMLSTGVFDGAVRATDRRQVEKEVGEALHPHLRKDGTVWMPNVFRYLIARVP
ncbi:class I SAM-dependent methyltransferase [Streptomyces montanisoli]|uniref:Methyltransferase domain-containing protein n=1 Tax=Streptomyces montanisoli TaxID=2798581 RepID=A0A940M9B6_9ACTN|nr:methyltransferase domain-containing protein [Streptomyces montanisoli]